MLNKRQISFLLILIAFLMFTITIPQANAVLGVGDIVFDPQAYALQMQTYMDQIKNTIYQYYEWKNTITDLTYTVQNLKSLDTKLSAKNIDEILYSIYKIENIMYSVRGIGYSYENFQRLWDRTFPDFKRYNGMSGDDYARQSEIIRDQTNDAIYDAMRTQGLVSDIPDDKSTVNTLLSASATADGVLAAIQVSNQLLGQIIEQLMRMEMIIATSYRAEMSYYAQEVNNDAAAASKSKSILKIESKNTLQGSGRGEGAQSFL